MPTTIKFLTLGLLSVFWLAMHQQVNRIDNGEIYHLAAYHRDRRKAKFYFRSVWVGLIAAFVGFGCLEVLVSSGMSPLSGREGASSMFDSAAIRDGAIGILRGTGLWGLLVVGMVWSRIGIRASQTNTDGDSLLPFFEKKKKPE